MLLGHRCVCAVEIDQYARSVLIARQNDGSLPTFPVWDNVCTFDGTPWRGIVDVVCGGFPCQDISAAGKGAGIDGERSGLWKEFARIISEVRPRYVFVENSPMLTIRGLGTVLGDLAALGFDAEWGVLSAADVGANHRRERVWIVANAVGEQHEGAPHARWWPPGAQLLADTKSQRCGEAGELRCYEPTERPASGCEAMGNTNSINGWPGTGRHHGAEINDAGWWATEPDVGRVANGVAFRVDRLKAIGNGQVPQCAAKAWRILTHNSNYPTPPVG
ncbi:DNA cytosine methyltransferase [Thiobacillus denitrificans]